MLSVTLNKIGKKFNREWIFRHLTFEIHPHDKLVILGGNGSGKSTLLQTISGFVTPNEGDIIYTKISGGEKKLVEHEALRHQVSFASPYLQLVEDFTAPELIEHIATTKPFLNQLTATQILEIAQLSHAKHKFIKQYSSGMKQRLKLALAILADTSLLLLDEPLSNLDRNGAEWYKFMINTYTASRTSIVCSNAIAEEYFFCDRELNVTDYKN